MAQHGDILGAFAHRHPAVILTEGQIEGLMYTCSITVSDWCPTAGFLGQPTPCKKSRASGGFRALGYWTAFKTQR